MAHTQFFIAYILLIFTFSLSFLLVKYLHCIIVKDVYWKYIIIDTAITAVYFGLLFGSMSNYVVSTPDYILILTYFLIGMVVVPLIYSMVKKHFIMDHPKIANWLYPVYEFLTFIIGLSLGFGIISLIGFLAQRIHIM